MSSTRHYCMIALLLFATAIGAHAGERPEELVDRLLKPEDVRQMSQTYMSQYAIEFVRSWKAGLEPMDAATEEELLKDFTLRLMKDDMDLLPSLRQLYLHIFTVEELQAMVSFFDSPVGKSISDKSKLLDKEIAKIYYPGINDKAIGHWNDAVQGLRRAGKKL